MLFTEKERIKGLIEELNENYNIEDNELQHTYLYYSDKSNRVFEIREQYIGPNMPTVKELLDRSNWYQSFTKDVTLCFKAMLMYIPDNNN